MEVDTITKEQAMAALVDERQSELQLEADQRVLDEDSEKQKALLLVKCQERAQVIINERGQQVPPFMRALSEVETRVAKLRALKTEYHSLVEQVRKLGGSLGTQYPKPFGIEKREQHFALQNARQAMASVGGVI